MTELATNRFELIDAMRGTWERRIHPSVAAMNAYVEGYADARQFGFDDTWDQITAWVRSYLRVDIREQAHWTELIARAASVFGSEIPIFYAALDMGQGVTYADCKSWKTPTKWREKFAEEQRRVRGDTGHATPPPHRLELVRRREGRWHLFYFDERGRRYYEVTKSTDNALIGWASACLHIPPASWTPCDEARS